MGTPQVTSPPNLWGDDAVVPSVSIVVIDHGTGTSRDYLTDVCEMVTVVSHRALCRPAPYGHGIAITMRLGATETDIAPGEHVMHLDKVPDQPGELGDHRLNHGHPEAHVFPELEDDPQDLGPTMMHEALELEADPMLDEIAQGSDGTLRARELCDGVEAEWFEFKCSSGRTVRGSNFQLEPWFSGQNGDASLKFDYLGTCTHEGELREGGYSDRLVPGKGWTQDIKGQKRGYRVKVEALGLSRSQRRAKLYAPAP